MVVYILLVDSSENEANRVVGFILEGWLPLSVWAYDFFINYPKINTNNP